MHKNWKGSKETLLAQIVRIVEQFIRSDKINIVPGLFERDDLRRRLIITLNMTKVVQHIWEAIRFDNTDKLELFLIESDQFGQREIWGRGTQANPVSRQSGLTSISAFMIALGKRASRSN